MLRRKGRDLQTRDGNPVEIEEAILRTPIYATDIGRYGFHPAAEERVIFPYVVTNDGYYLMKEAMLRSQYPKAYAYLASRKRELKHRKQFAEWYSFSAPRNLDAHDKADFLVPLLADRGLFCKVPKQSHRYCLMASGGFSISVAEDSGYAPEYILGLLNSKLLFWVLHRISNIFRGGWITCTKQYVGRLPIHRISFSEPAECARHDSIARAVKVMIASREAFVSAKTSREKTASQRQIAATEKRIEQLVYEIYGLNEIEIALVESSQIKEKTDNNVAPLEQTALTLED